MHLHVLEAVDLMVASLNPQHSEIINENQTNSTKMHGDGQFVIEHVVLLTGGGNIVVDGIYDMAGCDIGFPLNDDIPLNVHSNYSIQMK